MNQEEFKREVKKGTYVDDALKYVVCGVFALAGFLILSRTIVEYDVSGIGMLLGIGLVSFGIYGFWRIGQDYHISVIESSAPIEEKWNVLLKYLKEKEFKTKSRNENVIRGYYQKNFWLGLEIIVCVKDQEWMVNVRGYKDSAESQFPINFGHSRKGRLELEEHLKKSITTSDRK